MSYINDKTVLDNMPWLTPERKHHILSTAEEAVSLAGRFCALKGCAGKAFTAALYHDCAKGIEKELLAKYPFDAEGFAGFPATLHAPLGACLARDMFGVSDPEILWAIKWHCTGRAGMTELEKAVFLADAIEPLRDYPGVAGIRAAAAASLDEGMKAYLENLIDHLRHAGKAINPYTLECMESCRRLRKL